MPYENLNTYTGHWFRRSSDNSVNVGGDIFGTKKEVSVKFETAKILFHMSLKTSSNSVWCLTYYASATN